MEDLAKKSLLITGASRGIGRAIALHMAPKTKSIFCCARSQENLNGLKIEAGDNGDKINTISLDLMQANGAGNLLRWLAENETIPDLLLHNLGGSLGYRDPFSDADKFREVWQYNVGISIEINRFLIPKMIRRGGGLIIHFSTLSTKTFQGNLPYVSAKCALEGYIKNMSREIASQGVIMCGIAPGLVNLEGRYFSNLRDENPNEFQKYCEAHLPTGKMIEVEEITSFVELLCAGASDAMVGAIFDLNGGAK